MLQEIRNKSQGWIAKTIIAVIVLIFALTGFEAIFRAVGHGDEVASIDGQGISKQLFEDTYKQQAYILRVNNQFDDSDEAKQKLQELVLNNLINYQLLIQAADKAGFAYLPIAFVRQVIENNPVYQTDGRFDLSLFQQDIMAQGYATENSFVQDFLNRVYLSQLQSGIVNAGFVTEQQVQYFASLLMQTRDFSYKEIQAADIDDVTPEEISAWYENNKDTLKTSEQVVLQYIELNKQDFINKIVVPDEELQALYTNKVAALQAMPERKRLAHILIPVTSTQSDEIAKAKAEEIAKQLKAGKSFATLAKENSADTGTADIGGDLGFVNVDDLPDPEAFAPVLSTLNKAGDISQPVRSKFGWHLIELTDIQKTAIPSFESMQAELTHQLQQQKGANNYQEAQGNLNNVAYENYDSLTGVADQLKLELKETKPFARTEGYDALTKNDKLLQTAFSKDLLKGDENSQIIELTPDTSVVIRVKEHLEPKLMTLEQATPIIKLKLQEEHAALLGKQLIADVRSGKESIDDWKSFTDVQQPLALQLMNNGSEPPVAKEVIEKLFSTPQPIDAKPTVSGVKLANGNYGVIVLTKVNTFEGKLTKAEEARYMILIGNNTNSNLLSEYQNYIKANAKIKYFDL